MHLGTTYYFGHSNISSLCSLCRCSTAKPTYISDWGCTIVAISIIDIGMLLTRWNTSWKPSNFSIRICLLFNLGEKITWCSGDETAKHKIKNQINTLGIQKYTTMVTTDSDSTFWPLHVCFDSSDSNLGFLKYFLINPFWFSMKRRNRTECT